MINLVTDIFTVRRNYTWTPFLLLWVMKQSLVLNLGPLGVLSFISLCFLWEAVLCSLTGIPQGCSRPYVYDARPWTRWFHVPWWAPHTEMFPKPNSSPRFCLLLINSTMVHPEIHIQLTHFIVSFWLTVSLSCTKSLWTHTLQNLSHSFSFLHFYSHDAGSAPSVSLIWPSVSTDLPHSDTFSHLSDTLWPEVKLYPSPDCKRSEAEPTIWYHGN